MSFFFTWFANRVCQACWEGLAKFVREAEGPDDGATRGVDDAVAALKNRIHGHPALPAPAPEPEEPANGHAKSRKATARS